MSTTIIQRKHMATLHLLCKRLIEEQVRISKLPIGNPIVAAAFMGLPTPSYLWSGVNGGALGEFFAQYNHFEQPLVSSVQLHRMFARLREARLLYDPERPEDLALMGNPHVLIPTEMGMIFHRKFIDDYGDNPIYWPDSIEVSGGAMMNEKRRSRFAPAFAPNQTQ
jgi:hypothetical protein